MRRASVSHAGWLAAILAALVLASSGCRRTDEVESTRRDVIAQLPKDGRVPEPLRLGATPTTGADTAELFSPLIAHLRGSGINAEVIVASDYDALVDLVRKGAVDMAALSPIAYVKARRSMPALAIATATRGGSPTYIGYLVVRADDPVDSIEGLRARRVAWVERSSTSGYLFARALLRSTVADPERFFSSEVFVGSHGAVITAVARGEVDVGAVASVFVDPGLPERHPDAERLKVLAKTSRIPLDCIVVHRAVSRDFAEKIRDALLALSESHAAAAALGQTWGVTGFVPANDERYDSVADVLTRDRAP